MSSVAPSVVSGRSLAAGRPRAGGARAASGRQQLRAEELSARILEELEGVESVAAVEQLPSRGDLRGLERQAFEAFAPALALRRSSSTPSELGQGSPCGRSEARGASDAAASAASCSGRSPLLAGSALRAAGATARPAFQRHFGTAARKGHFPPRLDSELGPGAYDTQEVGALVWERDHDVSHPGQKQLSNHRSPVLTSFGKPKASGVPSAPPLSRLPGPGHYLLPDLWDPQWQHFPPRGKSFVRKPPTPGESRFGGLARSFAKDAKGDMSFLA